MVQPLKVPGRGQSDIEHNQKRHQIHYPLFQSSGAEQNGNFFLRLNLMNNNSRRLFHQRGNISAAFMRNLINLGELPDFRNLQLIPNLLPQLRKGDIIFSARLQHLDNPAYAAVPAIERFHIPITGQKGVFCRKSGFLSGRHQQQQFLKLFSCLFFLFLPQRPFLHTVIQIPRGR